MSILRPFFIIIIINLWAVKWGPLWTVRVFFFSSRKIKQKELWVLQYFTHQYFSQWPTTFITWDGLFQTWTLDCDFLSPGPMKNICLLQTSVLVSCRTVSQGHFKEASSKVLHERYILEGFLVRQKLKTLKFTLPPAFLPLPPPFPQVRWGQSLSKDGVIRSSDATVLPGGLATSIFKRISNGSTWFTLEQKSFRAESTSRLTVPRKLVYVCVCVVCLFTYSIYITHIYLFNCVFKCR